MTETMFRGALTARRPLIVAALQTNYRKLGIKLNDPERFFDLFMEAFVAEFAEAMRRETVPLYLKTLSPEDLAALATFYRTDAGQHLIAATPAIFQESAQIGNRVGAVAGARAGFRLADQLRDENLLQAEDGSTVQKLIEMLK